MAHMSVLLVDDETEYRDILAKRLKKRDVDLVTVASGEAALDALRSSGIDVVILDVRMGGMDGIQTLREIKRREVPVEVILLTGHANVEVAMEGMELGAFDYLIKPVNLDELLYRLQDAFDKKRLKAGASCGTQAAGE